LESIKININPQSLFLAQNQQDWLNALDFLKAKVINKAVNESIKTISLR